MRIRQFLLGILLVVSLLVNPLSVMAQESNEAPIYKGNTQYMTNDTLEISTAELYLVAQTMTHEAKYEGEDGLAAVGEVIYNRYHSDLFPDTIEEILFQKNQFVGAEELKQINPTDESLIIARRIFSGGDRILYDDNIYFFRNAKGSTEDWGKYKYETTIGHHQFYSYNP